jgi:hypothetical protein
MLPFAQSVDYTGREITEIAIGALRSATKRQCARRLTPFGQANVANSGEISFERNTNANGLSVDWFWSRFPGATCESVSSRQRLRSIPQAC